MRNAIIIIIRGKKRWETEVKELEKYPLKWIVKNPRAGSISKNNLPNDYQKIVQVLDEFKLEKKDS